MNAETVTRYVVQALLESGNWVDASTPEEHLERARHTVRNGTVAGAKGKLRVIERRTTVVDEVLP